MSSADIFAIALVALSGALIYSHWRTWQQVRSQNIDDPNRSFARNQFRRRIQASSMMGAIGAALFMGQFVGGAFWRLAYWLGVLVLVLWVMVLAFADALATRTHYGRLRKRDQDTELKLRAELRRLRESDES